MFAAKAVEERDAMRLARDDAEQASVEAERKALLLAKERDDALAEAQRQKQHNAIVTGELRSVNRRLAQVQSECGRFREERDAADASLRAMREKLSGALAEVSRAVPVADAAAVAAQKELDAQACDAVADKCEADGDNEGRCAALECAAAIRRGGDL